MTALKDKVVVITGASSGIGAALAERIARDGARPVLVARRRELLNAVAERCGGRATVVVADMTVRAEVRRAVAEAAAAHGRIDVWVNNAGRGISRVPTMLTEDDIDEMMRVNVKSAFFGMQEALPVFRAQGGGQIINVSSMLGRIPSALFRASYTASKHFLNALTDAFRTELRESDPGIQVSLVSPGVVYTDFGKNAVHGGPDSRAIPGGQDVADVVEVIVGVIESRRADVYTRPGAQAQVAAYYAGLGTDP